MVSLLALVLSPFAWLRLAEEVLHTQSFEIDLGFSFDIFDVPFSRRGKHRDAASFLTLPCCSARSMNIGLRIVGRLDLDNQIDIWEIKSSGSYIRGNQYFQLPLLILPICALSLKLGHISMQRLVDLPLIVESVRQSHRVCLPLTENNDVAWADCKFVDEIDHYLGLAEFHIVVGQFHGVVGESGGSGEIFLPDQIYVLPVFVEVDLGDLLQPGRNGGWKEQVLCFFGRVIFDVLVYLLDLFFEALFKHLISLVQT